MFSIICVTWKNQKQAQELVDSIVKHSYYNTHDILVFHNEYFPKDTNEKYIKISQSNGQFTGIIGNLGDPKNIGLSAATNKAAKYARKEFVVLCDDDMTVTKDWDLALLKGLNDYGQKWVSSTRIESPAPHYNLTPADVDRGRKKHQPWYHNISNCPILMPREFWEKIGGYDEDFPNVGAELGLAKRAYDAGERLFLQVPDSFANHKQSQSMKRLGGLRGWRKHRDRTFLEKYGISRTQFTTIIQKGVVYDPIN